MDGAKRRASVGGVAASKRGRPVAGWFARYSSWFSKINLVNGRVLQVIELLILY